MDLSNCAGYRCTPYTRGTAVFGESWMYAHCAVLVGHKCIVVGGYSDKARVSKNIYILDTIQRIWSAFQVPSELLLYGSARMQFINADKFTVLVYPRSLPPSERLYCMLEIDLVLLDEWTVVQAKAVPRLREGTTGCLVEVINEAIVFGGSRGGTSVFRYQVDERRWIEAKTAGKPPSARQNHAMCASGTVVFVIGGSYERATVLDVHLLDVSHLPFRWSSPVVGTYTPSKSFLFHAACVGNRILVYGGFNKTNRLCVYLIKEERWLQGVNSPVVSHETEIAFHSDWRDGTSAHALAHTSKKVWIFGGFEMRSKTHLELEAM